MTTPPATGLTVMNADVHGQVIDVTSRRRRPRVLMVAANPGVNPAHGWPVGFWAAELFHPYHEFTKRRYEVTVASPEGGKLSLDQLSDPRDQSRWSAGDILSLGALNSPELMALIEYTPALRDLDLDRYDALMAVGGQGPMFQFREHEDLKRAIVTFFEAEKPVAALCHALAALLDVQLSDGSYLLAGRTVTGFANVEEDFSDAAAGVTVMPYRIEDALRGRGANYIQAGLFKAFAVRDHNLITGQQQYSGERVAQLVIQALGD
jgi:putative intracellular protease/amidase